MVDNIKIEPLPRLATHNLSDLVAPYPGYSSTTVSDRYVGCYDEFIVENIILLT